MLQAGTESFVFAEFVSGLQGRHIVFRTQLELGMNMKSHS